MKDRTKKSSWIICARLDSKFVGL